MLFYFKYANFVLSSANALLGTSFSPIQGISTLPLGISFYTFQTLSYTIDVYRRDVKTEHNIIDFGAYVVMFPQLIAGPIVKYRDVAAQLHVTHGRYNLKQIEDGMTLFTFGLAKKVLLADTIGALWTDIIGIADSPSTTFVGLANASTALVWLGVIAYSLQLYFDFSGYSMMGIGMGKMLGFDFPQNFNYPYISASITEFWRRWHISLGSWFRDYVYIPLGGNRVSKEKWLRNILVVWMLTGLWHGASWTFVLWGLGFAVLLVAEKLVYGRLLQRTHVLKHVYTLLLVTLSFVLFNADSVSEAVSQLGAMFGAGGLPLVSTEGVYYLKSYAGTFLFAAIGATPLVSNAISRFGKTRFGAQALTVLQPLVMLALLAACTAFLVDGSFNPFLYFRF